MMGTSHGKDGVVKIGANAVAEVTAWSLSESAAVADDTSMGKSWQTHIPGKTVNSWSGSINCNLDQADATGQEVLIVGASVTLKLYAAGAGALAKYKTGLATITKVDQDADMSRTNKRSFSFQGNGALTGDAEDA
jgi:hypothetical protein